MPYKPWNAQKETVTAKKKKKETKLGEKTMKTPNKFQTAEMISKTMV